MDRKLRICVLTCSDTRSSGEAEDTAGPFLQKLCMERGWHIADYAICPDDKEKIEKELIRMSEEADIILTCGGTGFGPRDISPEATSAVIDRYVPGIAEAIRSESMRITPRAMLSRGIAGMRKKTLIINLPGSRKAAGESFGIVADQLVHAVEMMHGGGH